MATERDHLFGKLAFREGLVTDLELEECLKAQAQSADLRRLGEVMVDLGYLSKVQVAAVLKKQSKAIMTCEGCSLSFNVLLGKDATPPACPKCKGALKENRPPKSLTVDAEIDAERPGEEKGDMNMTRAVFSIDPEDVAASMDPPPQNPAAPPKRPTGPPKKTIGKRDSRIEPGRKVFKNTMKGLPPSRPFTSVIRKPKGASAANEVARQYQRTALCPICSTTFEGTVDASGHMRCISCHTRFKVK